jgi:cysteine desulfuration protein SufE
MISIEERLARFRALGREMRLQMLLQHARRFPELPEELNEARNRGLGRIEECQTPLFLWVSVDEEDRVTLHADAPREAPTVRGFVGFLLEVLEGARAEDVARLPDDLLDRMGMGEVLGVMRTQGLGAVVRRIKGDVARAASSSD